MRVLSLSVYLVVLVFSSVSFATSQRVCEYDRSIVKLDEKYCVVEIVKSLKGQAPLIGECLYTFDDELDEESTAQQFEICHSFKENVSFQTHYGSALADFEVLHWMQPVN